MLGPLGLAVGGLVSYICGAFIPYQYVPYYIIGFPIVFVVVIPFMPDTPHTLIRKNKMKEIFLAT